MNAVDYALAYLQRGWCPIPIQPRSKMPCNKAWQKLRPTAAEIPTLFEEHSNIGILTGAPSKHLVDIDLDCSEAVRLAPKILPPTIVFGRQSNPASHWLYSAFGAQSESFTTPIQLWGKKDPKKVVTVLEIRTDGKQTVFPHSIHESGEEIQWVGDDSETTPPTETKAEVLRSSVVRLASASLLVHFGWKDDDALAFISHPNPSALGALPPEVQALIARWTGPAVAPPATTKLKKPKGAHQDFDQAAENWCNDHPPIPFEKKYNNPCPVCNDSRSFGPLQGNLKKWCCYSDQHPDDVGRPRDTGQRCYWGDALDLECARRGKPSSYRRQLLIEDGYLKPHLRVLAQPKMPEPPLPSPPPDFDTVMEDSGAAAAVAHKFDELPPNDSPEHDRREPPNPPAPPPSVPRRAWRSRSYLTAVDIIQTNARDVLEGRKLERNEMSGMVEIGRVQIKETDVSHIRALIEARFVGGYTKNDDEIGLQLAKSDVFDAVEQVASQSLFHPVRDYLESLVWDKEPRIKRVAKTLLGAEDTALNNALVFRFFISAVARPMKPGCKCDNVFILVGRQGLKKSSFFRVVSSPWFVDTPIDISRDPVRAYMTLRKAWLLEWAELEPMLRARRHEEVKGFLSSASDEYVPKHARYSVEVARGGVIVGSTNSDEFLSDETGERRYLPMRAGRIDLDLTAKWRDQLWAEAVHYYNAGEQWWLTDDEEVLFNPQRGQYKIRDVWADKLLAWADTYPRAFTTSEALEHGMGMKLEACGRAEEMRIAKILKPDGWERVTASENKNTKVWTKKK